MKALRAYNTKLSGWEKMKEIKHIVLSQIFTIAVFSGIVLGSLTSKPVYITKIIKVMPEQVYPEYIMRHALIHHGVYATKKEENGDWIGIDKKKRPFKLFKGVKQ
jgi:hypothetical protein